MTSNNKIYSLGLYTDYVIKYLLILTLTAIIYIYIRKKTAERGETVVVVEIKKNPKRVGWAKRAVRVEDRRWGMWGM